MIELTNEAINSLKGIAFEINKEAMEGVEEDRYELADDDPDLVELDEVLDRLNERGVPYVAYIQNAIREDDVGVRLRKSEVPKGSGRMTIYFALMALALFIVDKE